MTGRCPCRGWLSRSRKGKKVSNQERENSHDPDARIAKMKDGRTHLAYKAQHTVDLPSEAIVSAHGPAEVEEVVADKGDHDNRSLAECAAWDVRTYIPERKQKVRRWVDKPGEYEVAFRANHRQVRGRKDGA